MPNFGQKLNTDKNQNNPKIRTEVIHAKPQRYRNESTNDTGTYSWKLNGNLNGKKVKVRIFPNYRVCVILKAREIPINTAI